jgi:hypothetical protein
MLSKSRVISFWLLWLATGLTHVALLVYMNYEYRDCCTDYNYPNPLSRNIFYGFTLIVLPIRYLLLRYVLALRLQGWGRWTVYGVILGGILACLISLLLYFSVANLSRFLFGGLPDQLSAYFGAILYILFRLFLIFVQWVSLTKLNNRWAVRNISGAILASIALLIDASIYYGNDWIFPYLSIAGFAISEMLTANSYVQIRLKELSAPQNVEGILQVY